MYPYYFTFTSYAKGRWIGSTIYNLFCSEFQAETPEYYVIPFVSVSLNNLSVYRLKHLRLERLLVCYVCTVAIH